MTTDVSPVPPAGAPDLAGAATPDPLGVVIGLVGTGTATAVSVSSAGDVNGDGIDDLMIGLPPGDALGEGADGAVYVVFGSDAPDAAARLAEIDLAALDGTDGFVIAGDPAAARPGYSVAAAGDVNGDGIDDIVIGASGHTQKGDGHAGTAYVVFGRDTAVDGGFAPVVELGALDGTDGFAIQGSNRNDAFAYKVNAAGDVNDDGLADIIIGAYGVDADGATNTGAAYVVFGRDTAALGGFDALLPVDTLDGSNGFVIPGLATRDAAGHSVAGAGDVNGDGVADILIGAYGAEVRGNDDAGEAYVIYGKDTAVDGAFDAEFDLTGLNGTNGFRLRGSSAGESIGRNVSAAGDLNNDGIDDIVVSGFSYTAAGNPDGTVHVVFGRDTSLDGDFNRGVNLSTLDGTTGFRIDALGANDLFGRHIASVGDVNGDGIDDLLIGAPLADVGGIDGTGEVYLVFGRNGGFGATLDLATLDGANGYRISGVFPGERIGFSVATPGDIDGDGTNDLVIGAHGFDGAVPFSDRLEAAYVLFGGEDSLDALDTLDGTADGAIDLAMLLARGQSPEWLFGWHHEAPGWAYDHGWFFDQVLTWEIDFSYGWHVDLRVGVHFDWTYGLHQAPRFGWHLEWSFDSTGVGDAGWSLGWDYGLHLSWYFGWGRELDNGVHFRWDHGFDWYALSMDTVLALDWHWDFHAWDYWDYGWYHGVSAGAHGWTWDYWLFVHG